MGLNDNFYFFINKKVKNDEKNNSFTPYKCTFCYRMDEGFRPRSSEGIIEEIKMLQKDFGINYIDFYDELLVSSVARTRQICEDFIKSGLKFKWMCQGRLNFAKPELLQLMKRAGFTSSGCIWKYLFNAVFLAQKVK